MATLSHGETRRMYSWWWDSHISPKNSKWLQENLTDMDLKVNSMIKLLEEDADSFARRAEMYYKKRPELMKLVEEFYRAYRALAERYDHATGALRQAHRTMAEAFPNQIPLILTDESPSNSSSAAEPHTPEMPPPLCAPFDPDELQKDALGVSSHFHTINRNGSYSEENDSLMSRKGLKQLNDLFETGEGAPRPKFSEGRVRKGLIFHEEAIKGSEVKKQNNDLAEREAEIKCLQEKVSELSTEIHDLETRLTSESERSVKAETEVQSFKEMLSELKSEKEAAVLRNRESLERIAGLEAEISHLQGELKKLNDDMVIEGSKLSNAEQRCVLLEQDYHSLQLELGKLQQKTKLQESALQEKQEEVEKLSTCLKDGQQQCLQAETALQAMEKLHSESQQEVKLLAHEVLSNNERLNGMERSILDLQQEVKHLKMENNNLHEQNRSSAMLMKNLQDEIISLKETKGILEDEVRLHLEEKKIIQEEFDNLKEERKDLEQRHKDLAEQLKMVTSNAESLQTSVKELKGENAELKVSCKKHEDEQARNVENLKYLEKAAEKNAELEVSLSDAQVELEGLRDKIKSLQSSCQSLHDQNALHSSEKALLVNQVESISRNMEKLSEKNTVLENSLSDLSGELESVRGKLKDSEESCQLLSDQRYNLLNEKNDLVSQVDSLNISLENMERKYAEVEEQNLILNEQRTSMHDQLRELHDCLKQEKQERERQFHSNKNQQAILENRIYVLQEEARLRDAEFVVEQEQNINAEIEICILREFLSDMKESNSVISIECKKHLEASVHLEKLISQLKLEDVKQREKLELLSMDNQKLRIGIDAMLKALSINTEVGSSNVVIDDDEFIKIILSRIRNLLDIISDAEDEKQHLILEQLVITTVLQRLGLDLANLTSEKNLLEQEFKSRTDELLQLQAKVHELLELKEKLMQDAEASYKREEVLKDKQLSLEEAHLQSQVEICKLKKENQSLSMSFHALQVKKALLEEDISQTLGEAIRHEFLHLVFSGITAEKMSVLKLSLDELDCLNAVKIELNREITVLNEKLGLLEVENLHFKEQVSCLEDCKKQMMILEAELTAMRTTCEQLNVRIKTRETLLMAKSVELSEVNQKLQGVYETSQSKIHELMEENQILSEKLHDIMQKKDDVEEENSVLVQEFMAMECLYVILNGLSADRALELKSFSDYLDLLCGVNDDLNQQIRVLDEKVRALDVENMHLNESVVRLGSDLKTAEDVREQLNHQIELGKGLLMQKEMGLLEANERALEAHQLAQREMSTLLEEKHCLSNNLDDLMKKMDAVEEENSVIFREALALDCLYSISTNQNAEKIGELELLCNDLDQLHGINQSLDQEVRILNGKIGFVEEENLQLKESKLYLEECRSQLQDSVHRSEIEIERLVEENQSMTLKFNELMEKKEAVEEENGLILAEVMTFDFLQLIFQSLSTDRALELESLSSDLKCLIAVKDELDEQIGMLNERITSLEVENMCLKESVVHLEECRNRIISLEDELRAARIIYDELNLQVEAGKNSLVQKEMELSEANQKVLSIKEHNAEVYKNLQELKVDIDGAKMIREELENKISTLLEGNSIKEKEILRICETKGWLEGELDKLQKESEILRSREKCLTYELQKRIDEAEFSEQEVVSLVGDIQVSTINAAILEEKLLEMLLVCESLEIDTMVLTKILDKEIDTTYVYMNALKKELEDIKGENMGLKGDLNSYTFLAVCLSDTIASLKDHTLSLKKLCDETYRGNEENSSRCHDLDEKGQEPNEAYQSHVPAGVLRLRESLATVEALQKTVINTKILIEKKRSSKIKDHRGDHLGRNLNVHEDNGDVSKAKCGQMMKDIQLDKVSSSSLYGNNVSSHRPIRTGSGETDDQMLELWETAERDCNNQMRKESSATTELGIEYHEIEAVEEAKSDYPSSEIVAEKELSIDKLELPRQDTESYQVWKTRVIEKLVGDTQRLSALQMSLQELKKKMEGSEKSKHSTSFKYDNIKTQLKEADEALMQLVDANGKLMKKAEDYSDNNEHEKEDIRGRRRRQLSERARRGSEKISGLELELQKIQYIMLKLEEENESRFRALERKSSVLLRDYLYGRREGSKHKKRLCGCMRPKTTGD